MNSIAGPLRDGLSVFRDGHPNNPLAWLALLRHDYLSAKLSADANAWQLLATEYSKRGPIIPKELRRSEEMFALDVDEARCKM